MADNLLLEARGHLAPPEAYAHGAPSDRGAEWDITNGVVLVKPCGCQRDLVKRQSLDEHHGGCIFSNFKSDEWLDNEISKVRDDDGFTREYRSKHKAKQAASAYRCLLERIDRLERESEVGPYSPTTMELMRNLAQEKRIENVGGENLSLPEQIKKHDQAIAKAVLNNVGYIGQSGMYPTMRREPGAVYDIKLGDGEHHMSRDEMLVEIGAGRAKAKPPPPARPGKRSMG